MGRVLNLPGMYRTDEKLESKFVSQVDYFQGRGGALAALLPVKPVATLYSSPGDFFAWTMLIKKQNKTFAI